MLTAAALTGAAWQRNTNASLLIRNGIIVDDAAAESSVLAMKDMDGFRGRSLQTVACTPANDNDYNYEACLAWCPNNPANNCPRCKYVHRVDDAMLYP